MPHLIVVEGLNQGKTFQVHSQETVGSEAGCSIVLSDRRVAPRHAEIRRRRNGSCEIRSLDRKKAVLVNGEIIRSVMLQHGDWITISDTTLVFSEDTDPDDRRTVEVDAIDTDDLLRSQIHTRRKQFEDAESVLESLDQLGGNADTRLRTLYKVFHELSQIIQMRQLLERLAEICVELFGGDRAFVLLLDEDSNRLKFKAARTRSGMNESNDFSRTIIKEVFKTKEAVLCLDAMDDERFLSGQSIVDQNLRSFMCVPFMYQGKLTGIVQVNSSDEGEPFSSDDLDLLSAIAMQVAVLIENTKAYRKHREYNQTLFHLGRATQQLSSLLQKDRILKESVSIACKLLNCTKGSIMLRTSSGGLRLASVSGMTPEDWAKIDKTALGERFVQKVIEDGASLLVEDIRELGFKPRARYTSNSLLIVPIDSSEDGQHPLGVICVTDKSSNRRFSGHDEKVLSILAGQVAITLKNADLYEKATVDSLTKVYVRRFFFLRLEEEMASARENSLPMSLLMLDVDHFKRVNDDYSHPAGDAVLKKFGAVLKKCVRPSDTVARYGGEEFTIILAKADETRASRVAERIRKTVEATEFPIPEGVSIQKTVSIGISTLTEGDRRDDLVKRADTALYVAKNGGRNQYKLYDPSMD